MNSETNISKTQQSKQGQSSAPGNNVEANGVLPLMAAVLNKLKALGVVCIVMNDDEAGALAVVIKGARVDDTPMGTKRFSMREDQPAQGGNDASN